MMLRAGLNLRYLVKSCQKVKEKVYELNQNQEQHTSNNGCAKNITQSYEVEEEDGSDSDSDSESTSVSTTSCSRYFGRQMAYLNHVGQVFIFITVLC